jgi:hypothetical protein
MPESTQATTPSPAAPAAAPVIKPSDLPEPPAQAPRARRAKATAAAEPAFSDGGGRDADPEVMSVNPTPREQAGWKPDPFANKTGSGPQALAGEDLVRRGGGAEVRVEDRQAKLVEKFRADKAVTKLLRDEREKRHGAFDERKDAPEGDDEAPEMSPEEARAKGEEAGGDEKPEVEEAPAREERKTVAEIARLEREKRELRQKIKAAEGSRTEAAKLAAYREIAKEYPIAAIQAMFPDLSVDAIYEDDVKGKSKTAPADKLKVDPAARLAEEDARSGRDAELEEERSKRQAAEAQLAQGRIERAAAAQAKADPKRWELCQRDPDIGATVMKEAQRLLSESDAEAGGAGKGWRPKDDKEAAEFHAAILDDLEKHYAELGKRYGRAAAPEKKPAPKVPPRGQGGRFAPDDKPIDNYRYSRPPKRESVEDRQDRLIAKFRGVTLTDD